MDWKLELVVVPVSDVDRAKAFYTEKVGFNLDVDRRMGDTFRVVQMTPPGSACSITVGTGMPTGAPGSLKGLQLVVQTLPATPVPTTQLQLVVQVIGAWAAGRLLPSL